MWEATLEDGTVVTGEKRHFSDVKDKVKSLRFIYSGIVHRLPDNQPEYFCASTASVHIGGGEAVVESRWIGCRTQEGKIIRLRFSAFKNIVSVEIE